MVRVIGKQNFKEEEETRGIGQITKYLDDGTAALHVAQW